MTQILHQTSLNLLVYSPEPFQSPQTTPFWQCPNPPVTIPTEEPGKCPVSIINAYFTSFCTTPEAKTSWSDVCLPFDRIKDMRSTGFKDLFCFLKKIFGRFQVQNVWSLSPPPPKSSSKNRKIQSDLF